MWNRLMRKRDRITASRQAEGICEFAGRSAGDKGKCGSKASSRRFDPHSIQNRDVWDDSVDIELLLMDRRIALHDDGALGHFFHLVQ